VSNNKVISAEKKFDKSIIIYYTFYQTHAYTIFKAQLKKYHMKLKVSHEIILY